MKTCKEEDGNNNYDDSNTTIPRKKKNKNVNYSRILTTIFIGIMLMSSSSVVFFPPQEAQSFIGDEKKIKIASWNTLDFGGKFGGTAKINDPIILQAMTDVISQYDIIFVQEIANATANIPDPSNPSIR